MKICDVCRKTVTSLRAGPPELASLEVCEDCGQDFLRRLSTMETRVVEIRQQMRAEVVEEWRKARGEKADGAG